MFGILPFENFWRLRLPLFPELVHEGVQLRILYGRGLEARFTRRWYSTRDLTLSGSGPSGSGSFGVLPGSCSPPSDFSPLVFDKLCGRPPPFPLFFFPAILRLRRLRLCSALPLGRGSPSYFERVVPSTALRLMLASTFFFSLPSRSGRAFRLFAKTTPPVVG